MKKILITLLAFALILSAAFFTACGDTSPDDGNENRENNESNENNEKLTLTEITDISEFTIVRSDNSSQGEKDAAVALRDLFKEKFSLDLALSTDFGSSKTKEILVGHTSRSESKAAEGDVDSYSEYVIKRVGDKIVIMAGSDESLLNAVNFWLTSMVSSSGKLCIPKNANGYVYSPDVKLTTLTVEGVPMSNFAIYNGDSALSSGVEDLRLMLNEYADVHLSLTNDKSEAENMIYFEVSADDDKKSSLTVKDADIYITCSYYDTNWAAEYLRTVFDGTDGDSYDITSYIDSEAKIELQPLYDKDDLMAVLKTVYDSEQIIVGTEMGNAVNVVENTLNNYYEKSGEYPGILGLDVRCSNLYKLGDEGIAKVVADLTNYAQGGGIITASAHFSNPHEGDPTIENYKGTFGGDDAFAELITEGTAFNTTFKQELSAIADFFTLLRDNGIPVIWRPLHETNANFFWFGMIQKVNGQTIKISEESFINLWVYIHDYFTVERGLDNLLWEFGPNIGYPGPYMTEPLYGFPGTDYVDLVGFDWYTSENDYAIVAEAPTYDDLESLGLIVNINEFGPSGSLVASEGQKQEDIFSCRDILGFFEGFRREGYKFGYFLTWTAQWSIPSLGYSDELMASELTLGQSEVKALFETLN